MPAAGKYKPKRQRERRTPPHVSLANLRKATGLTLDEVRRRMTEQFPELQVERGTLSAIELGYRGASEQMLDALCKAYDLDPGSITTDYEPRQAKGSAA